MVKLISVMPSDSTTKKYIAEFKLDNDKIKKVNFGQKGYSDYTINKDKKRRDSYRARHEKDLLTKDPTRPGYLSYFLLWGDSVSLKENIKTFKSKFNV